MSDERDTRHGTADDGADAAEISRPSGKRTARRSRVSSARTDSTIAAERSTARTVSKTSGRADKDAPSNPIKRLITFLREVVTELRKVIWPSRKELIKNTSVVLVFVVVMVAYIRGLDLAFIQGVDWLFG